MTNAGIIQALCDRVAKDLRRTLIMLEVRLEIYPAWDERPILNMELAQLERARKQVRAMTDGTDRKRRATLALRMATTAVHTTIGQEVSLDALHALARTAAALYREVQNDFFTER